MATGITKKSPIITTLLFVWGSSLPNPQECPDEPYTAWK